MVQAAGGAHDASATRRALEELIQTYWFPLYAYVRRQGFPATTPSVAEDLVQGFLTRLLEKKDLAQVDRSKGKFRSFLLAAMKHFLANEHDKARAAKRGGGRPVIALDAAAAELRYAVEPADNMTAERLFDRRWALAVLDEVLARLRRQYEAAGKARLFEAVKDCLTAERGHVPYAQRAAALGMTEGALKTAVHRLRKQYRDLLRDEIAQTVTGPRQVEEEIAYLLNCL